MKREEYLEKLQLTLEESDFGPVEEAISYFNEILEDRIQEEGMDEEAAIATMESPEEIARKLVHSKSTQQATSAEKMAADEPFVSGIRIINARADQVRRIVIRDRNMRVNLRGWQRDDIEIRHPETEQIRYDFTLEDGVLSLTRQAPEFLFNFLLFKSSQPNMREVNVFVPYELAAELDLRTSNAKLDVKNVACWGTATYATSNATIDLDNVGAKTMQVKGSNGSIKLEKIQVKHTLTATNANARIKAEKILAPEALTLKTSNGKITVEQITTDALELTSSNGKIEGVLPGRQSDYTIRSQTSNSKNSLPRQQDGGSKSLGVRTSNSRIDIRFEGKL